MPTSVKPLFGTDIAVQHLFGSLPDQQAFVSNFILNYDANNIGFSAYRMEYQLTIGATAPSSATPSIQFYLATADDNGALRHIDGRLPFSTSAATVITTASTPTAANRRDMLQFIGVQPIRALANEQYNGSFLINTNGVRNFAIYAFNNTGQALAAAAGTHYIRLVAQSYDVR